MDIIQLLLSIINDLNYEKRWLLSFICRYIPLKQWAYDETHSPKYQKFKTDELPRIIPLEKKDWQHLRRQQWFQRPAPVQGLPHDVLPAGQPFPQGV